MGIVLGIDVCGRSIEQQNDKNLYTDSDHLSNYASHDIIGPILVDLINKI